MAVAVTRYCVGADLCTSKIFWAQAEADKNKPPITDFIGSLRRIQFKGRPAALEPSFWGKVITYMRKPVASYLSGSLVFHKKRSKLPMN